MANEGRRSQARTGPDTTRNHHEFLGTHQKPEKKPESTGGPTPWIRRQRDHDVAISGDEFGQKLRRLCTGLSLLRRVGDGPGGEIAGVSGGVRGEGAEEAGG